MLGIAVDARKMPAVSLVVPAVTTTLPCTPLTVLLMLLLYFRARHVVCVSVSSYEGVTRQDVPHGMGVMVFGNGTGGGFHFRDVRVGDT